jgi:hypothetical protein
MMITGLACGGEGAVVDMCCCTLIILYCLLERIGPIWRHLFEDEDIMSKAVTSICSAAVDMPCKWKYISLGSDYVE